MIIPRPGIPRPGTPFVKAEIIQEFEKVMVSDF
jgi:hypothetical protein